MKKFEIPYNFNFDKNYFDNLEANKDLWGYIDTIYLPCFVDTKIDNIQHNSREEFNHSPKTFDEYKWHIDKLKTYNIPITLLIQKDATEDMVEYHINNFGIYSFIINNDELAKKLKEKYGDKIKLTLSITRIITQEEIETKDLSMYDEICLFFYFTRHLNVIKELPKKYSYIALVNSRCLYDCSVVSKHWFDIKKLNQTCIRQLYRHGLLNMKISAYVRPQDLFVFDDYISTYKLQGREYTSDRIFKEFKAYATRQPLDISKCDNFNFENIEENYNISK